MRLAAILGTCLLLSWPCVGMLRSAHLANVWQSTPQENAQNNSSQHNPADKPPADSQEPAKQSATPPAPAAPAICSDKLQSGSNVKPDCKPKTSKTTKAKTRHRTQPPTTPAATTPPGTPTKTVVRNGSEDEPAMDLSPPVNKQKNDQQRDSTNQLLAASDANLKKISGRQLNASQQDTVKQIKSYMEQAKGSLDENVQRAYNLAVKANLLSAELAGK
jgi:hypothetical protein